MQDGPLAARKSSAAEVAARKVSNKMHSPRTSAVRTPVHTPVHAPPTSYPVYQPQGRNGFTFPSTAGELATMLRGWARDQRNISYLVVLSFLFWIICCLAMYSRGFNNGFLYAASTMPAILLWYCYHFADDLKRTLFSPNVAIAIFWASFICTLFFSGGFGAIGSGTAVTVVAFVFSIGFGGVGVGLLQNHIRVNRDSWRVNDCLVAWICTVVGASLFLGLIAGFVSDSAQERIAECKATGEKCRSAASLMAFGKAALPEELFKYVFILSVPRIHGRDMHELARTKERMSQRLVLYGVTAALGFSMTENLLIYSSTDVAEPEDKEQASKHRWLFTLILIRGVLLTPMHALTASIMALRRSRTTYLGRETHDIVAQVKQLALEALHFGIAFFMHGIYDFWALWNEYSYGHDSGPSDTFTLQALFWIVFMLFVLQRLLSSGVTGQTIFQQLYRNKADIPLPLTNNNLKYTGVTVQGVRMMSVIDTPRPSIPPPAFASPAAARASSARASMASPAGRLSTQRPPGRAGAMTLHSSPFSVAEQPMGFFLSSDDAAGTTHHNPLAE